MKWILMTKTVEYYCFLVWGSNYLWYWYPAYWAHYLFGSIHNMYPEQWRLGSCFCTCLLFTSAVISYRFTFYNWGKWLDTSNSITKKQWGTQEIAEDREAFQINELKNEWILSYVMLITLLDLEKIPVWKLLYIRRDVCESKDDMYKIYQLITPI
jgi:hypothetical protein